MSIMTSLLFGGRLSKYMPNSTDMYEGEEKTARKKDKL